MKLRFLTEPFLFRALYIDRMSTLYTLTLEEADSFLYENAVLRRIDDTTYSYTWRGWNLYCDLDEDTTESLLRLTLLPEGFLICTQISL